MRTIPAAPSSVERIAHRIDTAKEFERVPEPERSKAKQTARELCRRGRSIEDAIALAIKEAEHDAVERNPAADARSVPDVRQAARSANQK